ncbi:hypothetical protein F5Y03DRAFT_292901 [Xylaria venustula]|nr:hypothetical protein F5Y03DRAFT_292901 [Xylaria venustula]
MDRRTYESHMDWEYQNDAPMDPTSPFTQRAQNKNLFGNSSGFGAFGQNGLNGRTPVTPSKPLPPTPMQQQSPGIFATARTQRTTTAPSFRNPAFTTPRKPFDIDEMSAAESSPAATDASDLQDTPDNDQFVDVAQMTITPASVSKHRSLFPKKASGKGEILKPVFASRDKIRKRKRYNADKDISGYRLPYKQSGEGDSDYESDESTYQPNKALHHNQKRSRKTGWFGDFLDTISRHPHAPTVLGYWLWLGFNLSLVGCGIWILWFILAGLRSDFATAKAGVRAELVEEILKCQADYKANMCSPVEKRLPAIAQLCDEWEVCMAQNPDHVKKVQLGAKNIVEIINEIVDALSYKSLVLLILILILFLFSGRSLYKTANAYPDFSKHAPPAYGGPPHPSETPMPQQIYWQAIQPQTPRHNFRHLPSNDETPETDASPPPKFKALPPPETPSGRRSPTKTDRGRSRSPTKNRSPTKFY